MWPEPGLQLRKRILVRGVVDQDETERGRGEGEEVRQGEGRHRVRVPEEHDAVDHRRALSRVPSRFLSCKSEGGVLTHTGSYTVRGYRRCTAAVKPHAVQV